MTRSLSLLGFLGILMAVSPQVATDTAAWSTQSEVFRSGIDAVRLDVAVLDDGEPVTTLRAEDFEVLERGRSDVKVRPGYWSTAAPHAGPNCDVGAAADRRLVVTPHPASGTEDVGLTLVAKGASTSDAVILRLLATRDTARGSSFHGAELVVCGSAPPSASQVAARPHLVLHLDRGTILQGSIGDSPEQGTDAEVHVPFDRERLELLASATSLDGSFFGTGFGLTRAQLSAVADFARRVLR